MSDLEFSKKEKELLEHLTNATFLIADPTPTRRTIQKLLSACKVKPSNIRVADDDAEAIELINLHRPNVIFADHELPEKGGIELAKHHDRAVTSRHLKVFFLVSDTDSAALANTIADENIDALLVRPLSLTGLKESVFAVLSRKIHPSDYMATLQEGLALLDTGQIDRAKERFHAARRMDPGPALACYHEGMIALTQRNLEEAEECFQAGLRATSTHYRCLLGMFDLGLARRDYVRAYEYGKKIAEHHTVPLKRLPEFIAVSIQNHQFEDILDFYKLAKSLGAFGTTIAMPLGAGLVVAGLSFLRRGETDKALSAFKKAEVATKGNQEILKRAYYGLLEAGLAKEAVALSARFDRDVLDSTEAKLSEFRFLQKSVEPLKVLNHGIKLVREGLMDPVLFETVIRISVEVRRKPSSIQHLIDAASRAFPAKAAFYTGLVPGLAELVAQDELGDSGIDADLEF